MTRDDSVPEMRPEGHEFRLKLFHEWLSIAGQEIAGATVNSSIVCLVAPLKLIVSFPYSTGSMSSDNLMVFGFF